MLVLLHVVIGCGILFRFKVYQNLYSEQRAHPFFRVCLVLNNTNSFRYGLFFEHG